MKRKQIGSTKANLQIMDQALKITGTFLDEISHDINHQNWGEKEWEDDFRAMRSVGIDTVIMIRCGYKKWITYPSDVLIKKEHCFTPHTDYLALFLRLSEQYGMKFYFGLYDSGSHWVNERYEKEVEINLAIIEEVGRKYGHSPAFHGWYISHEINRNVPEIVDLYVKLGKFCKEVANLSVLISPYIDGEKAVNAHDKRLHKSNSISLAQHEQDWDEVLERGREAIDIVAFQDGHVDFHEIEDYMKINKKLAEKHGVQCWSNCESFDRDMPIKFLPIKWDKMLLKLQAAQQANAEKVITFEFSHFMSPNSSYIQARHLFNRYREHFGLIPERNFSTLHGNDLSRDEKKGM